MLQDGTHLGALEVGKNRDGDGPGREDPEIGHPPVGRVFGQDGHPVTRINSGPVQHARHITDSQLQFAVGIGRAVHA